MISIKSKREIDLMKEAGRIVALTHSMLEEKIRPGISTKDLDFLAKEFIISMGATPSFLGYGGFPASICTSVNNVLVHGIPSEHTILKDGDIISIDVGACYKGYHGDSAWTYAVGNISDDARELMEITRDSLFEGLKQVRPGNHIGDISNAIQKYVEEHGCSVPLGFTGHGIGLDLHEDPAIPNFGFKGEGDLIEEGMCFAIEPMVHRGKPHTKVLEDDWTVISKDASLTAHYEHTIVVTKDGYEILTRR